MAKIEFFFDYGSPYSFLANGVLPGIAEAKGATLVYRPILLGGVFKATGNKSPMTETVEAKRNYGGGAMGYREKGSSGFRVGPERPNCDREAAYVW